MRLAKLSEVDVEGVARYKKDTDDDTKTWSNLVPAFDNFFTNENSDESCPITDCKLLKPGCSLDADSSNARISKVDDKF